jgi:hypothetical protein
MTDTPMKSIVLFSSDLFDNEWREDLDAVPHGKDCAEFLQKGLASLGAEVLPRDAPSRDSFRWNVSARIEGRYFYFFVQSWIFGDPPRECWLITPGTTDLSGMGCLLAPFKWFFGLKIPESRLAPLSNLLRRVIENEQKINNITWFTREEFGKVWAPVHRILPDENWSPDPTKRRQPPTI